MDVLLNKKLTSANETLQNIVPPVCAYLRRMAASSLHPSMRAHPLRGSIVGIHMCGELG
jgi:hypothetical protein